MDFGEEGASSIVINGRGAQSNSVHVVFDGTDGEEIKQLVEFPAESAFTEHRFLLRTAPDGVIRGRQTVSFVFLPGTMFDLRSFRFE
jgi:beta-galactosidase